MPHIPFSRLGATFEAAPRASRSSNVKPPVPYLGSGQDEVNPASRPGKTKSKLDFISRLDPIKHDVDPLRVLNLMAQGNREYKIDEHTRGLVFDDTSIT